ncbi:HEAT repeat domain-containing protein [Hyalangium versicolor]|uniref:HEAT repeat domain-containing protein n=1 Tax=Hyalangium versicolor TaxID=2861190 RepID=UPI001CCB7565|nr:HEAT repeat domain-containing protein [Hyalangium versicolor]
MSDELEHLKRKARPDDIESLRRLDRALQRTGWHVEGKTFREWISEYIQYPLNRYLDAPPPAEHLIASGLAAVPALVETLRTKRLSTESQHDIRIRGHCVLTLANIHPLPTCAVSALLETLRVPSTMLRRLTLRALAQFPLRPTPLAVDELLSCLALRHEPYVRAEAAGVLSRFGAPLPPEIRREALKRLTDPDSRVRRNVLRLLARLPAPDPEVRTALEEHVILDDANRLEAIRALLAFDEPRALKFLQDELLGVEKDERDNRRALVCLRALQLVEALGARAMPTLPALRRISHRASVAGFLYTAIDSIARDQLSAKSPAPSPEQLRDERAVRLLEAPTALRPDEPPDRALSRWAAGFLPYGRELCVRIALAAARHVANLWETEYSLYGSPRDALHLLAEWLDDPNDTSARRAVERADIIPSQLCAPSAFSASWCTTFATLCVATEEQLKEWTRGVQPLESAEGGFLGSAVLSACRALGSRSVITLALGSAEEAPRLSQEEAAREVRKAIVDEVLPWICGTWDPVKDVLERRRQWLAPPPAPAPGSTGRYPP